MKDEMEAGGSKGQRGLYRDLSIHLISTSGPRVCKEYVHWAVWILRESLAGDWMGAV